MKLSHKICPLIPADDNSKDQTDCTDYNKHTEADPPLQINGSRIILWITGVQFPIL